MHQSELWPSKFAITKPKQMCFCSLLFKCHPFFTNLPQICRHFRKKKRLIFFCFGKKKPTVVTFQPKITFCQKKVWAFGKPLFCFFRFSVLQSRCEPENVGHLLWRLNWKHCGHVSRGIGKKSAGKNIGPITFYSSKTPATEILSITFFSHISYSFYIHLSKDDVACYIFAFIGSGNESEHNL